MLRLELCFYLNDDLQKKIVMNQSMNSMQIEALL